MMIGYFIKPRTATNPEDFCFINRRPIMLKTTMFKVNIATIKKEPVAVVKSKTKY